MTEDLEKRFNADPVYGEQGMNIQNVRILIEESAKVIDNLVPAGREQSLALTKLEEAMFWANAGIARHGQ